MSKRKQLSHTIFSKKRKIGTFDTQHFTDILTVIESIRRKRNPLLSLNEPRFDAVKQQLVDGCLFGDIQGLTSQIDNWRNELYSEFDANEYYDDERAKSYHVHNVGPQLNLTNSLCDALDIVLGQPSSSPTESTVEMVVGDASAQAAATGTDVDATAPAADPSTPSADPSTPAAVPTTPSADSTTPSADSSTTHQLLLDLGTGTGLSAQYAANRWRNTHVIGVDSSQCMLDNNEHCLDTVRVDISQPLPFRDAVMDRVVSISALQYLFEDTPQRTSEQRLVTCLGSTLAVLDKERGTGPLVAGFQYHPRDGQEMAAREALRDAFEVLRQRNDADLDNVNLTVYVDQPHHSNAKRWFACLVWTPPGQPSQPHNAACAMYSTPDYRCGCILTLAAGGELPPAMRTAKHVVWTENEHLRHAKSLLRKLKRKRNCTIEELGRLKKFEFTALDEKVANNIEQALGENCTSKEHIHANKKKVLQILHTLP